MTTQTDKTYNGWTNYETWNVKLWMDNDEGSYHYWREVTEQVVRENSDVVLRRCELADLLKDNVEENNPLIDQPSMYSDLIGAAISEVNWHEIAENMLED